MLIIGNSKLADKVSANKIYNISSYREGFENLHLIPPQMMINEEKEFDIQYANYIMTTDAVFFDFMRIIFNLYMGNDVYLMVSDTNQLSVILTESLSKFIQQRYGCMVNRIFDEEDLLYLKDSDFSFQGVFNLDQDKERFSYMLANLIMSITNEEISKIVSAGGSMDYDTLFARKYEEYVSKYL